MTKREVQYVLVTRTDDADAFRDLVGCPFCGQPVTRGCLTLGGRRPAKLHAARTQAALNLIRSVGIPLPSDHEPRRGSQHEPRTHE